MSTDMAGASLLSYRPMSQVLLVIIVKIMIMIIRILDKIAWSSLIIMIVIYEPHARFGSTSVF